MDLTANYSLGKPLGTEDYDVGVPNANMDIIDGLLKARADVDVALDGRIDTLEGYFANDPGAVISDLFTAATDWTINEQAAFVWGPIIFIKFSVSRANSILTSNSDGNIGNVTLMNWASGKDAYKPHNGIEAGIASVEGGPLFGGFIGAGSVAINSLQGGINLPIGGNLRGSSMYFRAM